ncbi:MAG: TraB/GumN family protein [Sphingomonas sp.]
MPPLLALLALAACHPAPKAAPAAHPALWVVRDADTTIYLFGTVHTLKPDLSWFDGGLRKAFDASGQLVLELVLPPEAGMQALVTELGTQTGAPLSARLPADRAARLHAALTSLGQSPTALDRDEPWLAALTLSVLPLQRLGYDSEDGAEAVLTKAAVAAGKPVLGLETARVQLGYFDRLSPPAQAALLDEAIDDLPKARQTMEATVAAWSKGDTAALAHLVNDDLKRSPEIADALLVQRNRRWADWIAARMRAPGTVFVAVGAGHLAGPQAVQAELAKRGLKAERVAD